MDEFYTPLAFLKLLSSEEWRHSGSNALADAGYWAAYYELARASFEGGIPKEGENVHLLHGGMGNLNAGPIRKVLSVDADYIYVESSTPGSIGCIERDRWWASLIPVRLIDSEKNLRITYSNRDMMRCMAAALIPKRYVT